MSARDPARFRPVFLLAPARSCSSVVVSMLGQHPQLYGFPELRLFRGDRVSDLMTDPPAGTGMPARERASGVVRALAQLHEGEQSPATSERAWQWLHQRRDWSVAEVLDHLLDLIKPIAGVEKSPETSLSAQALARAWAAYPRARYLHLVRHPWATVASMVAAWSPVPYWDVPRDQALEYCAGLWLEQHRRIARFGAQAGPAQYRRIRAEDVMFRAQATLPPVCRWLGIDDGPACVAAMSTPERSVYAAPGPWNAPGGFDRSFMQRPELRARPAPPGLRAPASWGIRDSVQTAIRRLALEFGYDDEPACAGLPVAAMSAAFRRTPAWSRARFPPVPGSGDEG